MLPDDEAWMDRALSLAAEAAAMGEVPVGAIAVRDGQIVGRGFNRREVDQNPFAHAEFLAMSEAAKTLGVWRLTGVTVYVTLEPCAMCAGAMVLSRVDRVVYGASDPKAGAVGSLYDLLQEPRHNHRPMVTRGVRANECGEALSTFFRRLRVEKAGK